jgi:predicted RecB family nuclease
MRQQDSELILSATDLAGFLACRHRTALDMGAALGAHPAPPRYDDPLLRMLWQRGLDHEARYVDQLRAEGRTVVELRDAGDADVRVSATLQAMRDGADVIVQGALRDGPWFGYPDILQRVPTPSALGDWSYEVADTKLARETKAGTILQLGLYSKMLTTAQGVRAERFQVVTPVETETYRFDEYAAYFRLVLERMLAAVAMPHDALASAHYPEPVEHCAICRWARACRERRTLDDHLSLVAGITRLQRRELESRAVTTMTALAELPFPLDPEPRRGSHEAYERAGLQARLQVASKGKTPPLHELLGPVEPERGFCRLPEPTPGDLFLDLEGDPFVAEGGREYLFGFIRADGSYEARWAFTEPEERQGFEWAMDVIARAIAEHPTMRVYHYSPYEPAAFKRLMGRHATRENELDAMLRSGRFVDLYAVVRQGLRAGVERYSIKNLEPLYEFHRDVDLDLANLQLRELEKALETGATSLPPEVARAVEGYNRDDCVSTLRLRDWLETLRAGLIATGTEVPRPALENGEPSAELDEKAKEVEALRARLLARLPADRAEHDDPQRARWILAYLLDYHRRENKATWWEYFRLSDLPVEEWYDERDAVAGLEFVERLGFKIGKKGKPTRSVIDRYRYPPQEMEIDDGSKVRLDRKATAELLASEGKPTTDAQGREVSPIEVGKVVAVDRVARTIDIQKGPGRATLHPKAVFAFTFIGAQPMEQSLLRIGTAVADGGSQYPAARSLLERRPPRLCSGVFARPSHEDPTTYARRIAADLDRTTFAIQGPPGAGKTYCGAEMILELVGQGKRVGITANSHKVIRNLLDEVALHANRAGVPVALGHKCDDDDDVESAGVREFGDNASALAALQGNETQVLGGTAWMWAREEFADSVDVLFVDEAGQMALANVIAVSQAAGSLVLLGDPQQLEQPMQGSHPEGVAVSALQHLLGDEATMPDDRGLFLEHTWRLAPKICEFTSEVFYERRLVSRPGLERQQLVGVADVPSAGLALLEVPHDGNRNASDEEAVIVADLVERLTRNGLHWTDGDGAARPITGPDILIVAPYNAQVTKLRERVDGTGARVGTVDKFQGQQAPVVIYTMATSSPEEAPRGMEFLYSLNRLNVATSRAKCLAIVVMSPRLLEVECRTPRQMRLANALCRFRELAVPLT